MITLITGGPGTGKTAWTLNEILKLQKVEDRPLFVHGIRQLKIPHTPIYCKSKLCDLCQSQEIEEGALYVENWPDWKEPGALIVIDEVQRIWRPRAGSTPPHQSVSMLETHRHYGLDFWMVSQGPHLFDAFIRPLVGRHIHLMAQWNGRQQFEWAECHQQLTSRGDAVKRPYTLPKRVFDLYHSAEVHTKQPKRIPMAVYGLAGSLVLLAVVLGVIYTKFSDPQHFVPENMRPPEPVAGQAPVAIAANTPYPSNQAQAFPDFTPEQPGLAESAPAYRHLVQVKAAPLLAGCVRSKTKCRCFTAQATTYNTSEAFCNEVIKGNYFNPYIEHKPPPPTMTASANPAPMPAQADPHTPPDTYRPPQTVDESDVASHLY